MQKKVLCLIIIAFMSLAVNAQKRKFQFVTAAYVSTTQKGFYYGQSISIGVQKKIKKTNLILSGNLFSLKMKTAALTGINQLQQRSLHLSMKRYLYKKKIYSSLGVSYITEDAIINKQELYSTATSISGNYAFGYRISKQTTGAQLYVELFGIGPTIKNLGWTCATQPYSKTNYPKLINQIGLGLKTTF